MAIKKILTSEKLNQEIDKIKGRGFTPKTNYRYIQDSFSQIVIPQGQKGSGYVRSYGETNEYLKKVYGEKAVLLTEQEYENSIQQLNKALGKERLLKGFVESQRTKIERIIEDSFTYSDEDPIDISHISTSRLNQIINEAARLSRGDSKGSPTFYEYLMELILNEN